MKRKEPDEGNLKQSKTKMSKSFGNSEIDKEKKYDRQLRLWGDHGQRELERAKVCLINASATGVETLKCLILPGIGKFCIVDNNVVKEEDLGNNFFVERTSVGKPRAQCTCALLQELNDDVHGSFLVQDPGEMVENDPEFYREFDFVIASDLKESELLKLSDLLWRYNVPLLVCNVRGFIGYIRLVVKEHAVVEAHPDNTHEDLRLDIPFPGLIEYMNVMDLDSMDKHDHGHTPYLVIIYKYLEKWKQEHEGNWPKSYKEKTAFKEMISKGVLKNEHGVEEVEENFEEAVKNANYVLVPTKAPSNVLQIFGSPRCQHPAAPNLKFWILARAIKEFYESTGALPLRGSIPDMFSDSARYIQLQNVFKDQALKDIQSVHEIVEQCVIDMQLEDDLISEEDTKLFCKNAYFLHVISGHPLANELRHSMEENSHKIGDIIGDDENCLGLLYLLLRGINVFEHVNHRLPGSVDESIDEDFEKMKSILSEMASHLHIQVNVKDDYIKEICRCAAGQAHTIAAIIGGIASQEVIKVITKQFIPVNNTFIYNAISETSLTMEL